MKQPTDDLTLEDATVIYKDGQHVELPPPDSVTDALEAMTGKTRRKRAPKFPTINVRYDESDARYYGNVIVDMESNSKRVVWNPSVTEVIRKTSPTAPGLLAWYAQHGLKEANRLKDEAAAKGTEMHILFEQYLRMLQIGADQDYSGAISLQDLPVFHAKALLSLEQWVKDSNVVPIAMEQSVVNDVLGYAGTVDLICEMDFNKQRVVAIVDFKSGSNVYDDYAIQLEMYRLGWNRSNRGVNAVTHVFNWSPKDWAKSPSYALKNQTNAVTAEHVITRCKLYHAAFEARPKPRFRFEGHLPFGGKWSETNPDDMVFAQYRNYLTSKPQLLEVFDNLAIATPKK